MRHLQRLTLISAALLAFSFAHVGAARAVTPIDIGFDFNTPKTAVSVSIELGGGTSLIAPVDTVIQITDPNNILHIGGTVCLPPSPCLQSPMN
jgi:hypothetical protein